MDLKDKREEFINYIKRQLTGVDIKENVPSKQKPLDSIFTGFLFPIIESEDGLDSIDDDEHDDSEAEKTEAKQVRKQKRYIPPSSAGFSFFIAGEDINLRVYYDAVCYIQKTSEKDERNKLFIKQKWEKEKLTDDGEEREFSPKGQNQYIVFDDRAKIDALWRPHQNGYIVTITMSNNQKIVNIDDSKKFNIEQNEKTLFEIELKCIVDSGNIDVYPSKDKGLLTDEEKEIELRYKDLHIYAVGHGTGVNWDKNKFKEMEIRADFIPSVEVPQMTANTGEKTDNTLEFLFLKTCEENKEVIKKLDGFVKNYETWIKSQNQKANQEDEEDKNTAIKIIKNLTVARQRMQSGVELLKNDHNSRIAFATMNKAMLMQWVSNDKNNGITKENSHYKWRPFQLAFILIALKSVINEDSDYIYQLDNDLG